jgi:hypothetical protein
MHTAARDRDCGRGGSAARAPIAADARCRTWGLWMQRPPAFGEGYARRMTEHAQSLLREALSLSDDERADLIAELLVSLEGPVVDDVAAVEQAWAEELETRARRVLAGPAQGEEWSQVRARLGRALTDG